jgi:hypothetical protein
MIKRILLAIALVGAIAACNSPAASTPAGSTTSPASPDLSSPSTPALESPSESPAAS